MSGTLTYRIVEIVGGKPLPERRPFKTQDGAKAYIAKNKLGGTHRVEAVPPNKFGGNSRQKRFGK
jgi:hypothetical protein